MSLVSHTAAEIGTVFVLPVQARLPPMLLSPISIASGSPIGTALQREALADVIAKRAKPARGDG